MRKTFLILATVAMACTGVHAQSKPKPVKQTMTQGHPKVNFKSTTYDFGVVKAGANVVAIYNVDNVGDVPVIINKVIPTGGVSVLEYYAKPFFPGQGVVIKLKVDTDKPGRVEKQVKVDMTDQGVPHVLTIKGEVK